MNFQFYREKLEESKNFEEFKKKNPSSYFCSGFFVIDKEGKDNKIHFDYFLPKEKKIISFQLEKGIRQVPVEVFDKKIPEKIPLDQDFDFDDVEELIIKEMENQGIKSKLQKILLSLQEINTKISLVGTVFISMLGMLKIQINIENMKVIRFEKRSFLDMVNVLKRKDKEKDE